jgi:N-terminal domain of oxidoreductase
MVGGTVGEVVESNNAAFSVGDQVVGFLGWQLFAASTGVGLTKIDTRAIPPTVCLGAVGMPGVGAWVGVTQIGEPKPGETVVVSAAAGAVGSVVGQVAKIKGCRAVEGSCGGGNGRGERVGLGGFHENSCFAVVPSRVSHCVPRIPGALSHRSRLHSSGIPALRRPS